MNNLALCDRILYKIEKPARYTGNEKGAVYKERDKFLTRDYIRFAMCFPDVYEIGMSHVGLQILYHMFNSFEDVWCERVFSPWVDLDKIMREEKIPLFSLESQDRVRDFDFLGITLQYEMCYTNILQILDLSGIPILSKDRDWSSPIVIGGGPCSYNPEPIADFFDMFYIGEGEVSYRQLLDLYKEARQNNWERADFLEKAAIIPGIYVPCMYDTAYNTDGTIKEFVPKYPEIPAVVKRQIADNLRELDYPTKPVIPFIKVTQDRAVMEIQRGCIRGCRFCQAGQIYRPVRERDVEMLKETALKLLKYTGHEEISLSSLSSSDYSGLQELMDYLVSECEKRHVNISLPSLRIDNVAIDIMKKVQDVKKVSLTFAPEAGSQRLRDIINKGITEEDILTGSRLAFENGWTRVKLYFMLGLPGETEEDIEGIGDIANKIAAQFFEAVPREKRTQPVSIVVSTSFFIPKPFTPFQWVSMNSKEEFIEKAYVTRNGIAKQLNQKRIKYNWHEADVSFIEGLLARGDRRLSKVILDVYKKGCIFDAWSDLYNNDAWISACEENNVDLAFYTCREREISEILPWDFIDIGVTKEYLVREYEKAKKGQVSPNCQMQCSGCGLMDCCGFSGM